jgi:hypothetical protein
MRDHSATIKVPARASAFEAALEGLTRVNERLMTDPSLGGPSIPPLYSAGVKYKNEPRDVWRHAADVAKEGWGDCEDLSAYRAAELRVSGDDPGAYVTTYQSGPNRYHAVVARGDGSIEDPSRVLGMGAATTMKMPKHLTVLGADPTPDQGGITFEVVPIPGGGWGSRKGWRGVIRMPLGAMGLPGQAILQAGPPSSSPSAAIKSVAAAVTGNPSVQSAIANELAKVVPGGEAAKAILQQPAVKSLVQAGAKAAASVASNVGKKILSIF